MKKFLSSNFESTSRNYFFKPGYVPDPITANLKKLYDRHNAIISTLNGSPPQATNFKSLQPPATPQAAVEGTRNLCYGFNVLINMHEHKGIAETLEATRDQLLKLIDPDRPTKIKPVKSPFYIKQKYFHASVFGMPPLLERKDYELFASEKGILTSAKKDTMCDQLERYLQQAQPFLEFDRCEIMPDGTILARFAYKSQESKDETPLYTLAEQLDPDKQFSRWDPSNKARATSVTVAICRVDRTQLADKVEAIQSELQLATQQLKKICTDELSKDKSGKIPVTQFEFVDAYDKRTLSAKHTHHYASVSNKGIQRNFN